MSEQSTDILLVTVTFGETTEAATTDILETVEEFSKRILASIDAQRRIYMLRD
jgi:hypothetical protein